MKQENREKLMEKVFFIFALVSIIFVSLIFLFLLKYGFTAILDIGLKDFLLGKNWSPTDVPASYGILPMMLGSIYVTAGAVIIGVPIGVLTAVYLAKFSSKRVYKILKPATNLLAGIPSVIYGFFGMIIVVPIIRNIWGGNGNSILSAAILLGVMILPTVIGVAESAIKTVPATYYEGALALGASHERAIFSIVIPAAKSGILTGVVLGIGRAIGETMAVIMVAGNQARMPDGVLKGVRTLTANIAIEMGYAADLHRDALVATGLVLFVFIMIINILLSLLKRER